MIPNDALSNNKAKKELDKIKETENNADREKLIYKTNEYTYSSTIKIKSFGRNFVRVKLRLKKLMNMKPIY